MENNNNNNNNKRQQRARIEPQSSLQPALATNPLLPLPTVLTDVILSMVVDTSYYIGSIIDPMALAYVFVPRLCSDTARLISVNRYISRYITSVFKKRQVITIKCTAADLVHLPSGESIYRPTAGSVTSLWAWANILKARKVDDQDSAKIQSLRIHMVGGHTLSHITFILGRVSLSDAIRPSITHIEIVREATSSATNYVPLVGDMNDMAQLEMALFDVVERYPLLTGIDMRHIKYDPVSELEAKVYFMMICDGMMAELSTDIDNQRRIIVNGNIPIVGTMGCNVCNGALDNCYYGMQCDGVRCTQSTSTCAGCLYDNTVYYPAWLCPSHGGRFVHSLCRGNLGDQHCIHINQLCSPDWQVDTSVYCSGCIQQINTNQLCMLHPLICRSCGVIEAVEQRDPLCQIQHAISELVGNDHHHDQMSYQHYMCIRCCNKDEILHIIASIVVL